MKIGQFIWADLSTYNISNSSKFYNEVFGWKISDRNNYFLAQNGDATIAGIFETPDFLKNLKMPHFWMSYFQVDSTVKTVELAKRLNGKIEVDSIDFNNGTIALIRDPQGAGFTVYDGHELYLSKERVHGNIIRTELHVSNIKNVIPFYQSIFNWQITEIAPDVYQTQSQAYTNNILLKKFDNAVKGKYEYWVTTILVDNLDATTKHIIEKNGHLIMSESNKNLMSDNSGEAFFYIQQRSDTN